ncbi:MAG: UDP-N-acetylmuramate--L-alanine ligase [Alphaproteobacteria bacterium]
MKILGQAADKGIPIHFIGMGGIGMSGLAEVLYKQGFKVQGSDGASSYNTDRLAKLGVKTFIGHDAKNLPNQGVVVLSTAIKPNNVELVEAEKRGLTIMHRADILAEIMKHFKTIAVSGTHGKTSTTGLIWAALQAAGVDVGLINGGVMQDLGTNAILPKKSEGWLVVEADESDNSFTKLRHDIAVVTNIEPEHMDTFGSEEKLLEGFRTFILNARESAILCAEDPVLAEMALSVDIDTLTYGWSDNETLPDVSAEVPVPQGFGMAFDATVRGGKIDDCVVNLPGRHYVLNALAAMAVCSIVKADIIKSLAGLETFGGVARRFTKVGTFRGADIIDDYGHHPTEIAATVEAAKGLYHKGKVVAVVQPHRYTRLRDLMAQFATATKVADETILLPVYAAGEAEIKGVNHHALSALMKEQDVMNQTAENVDDLRKLLDVKAGDCILILGAGTSTAMAKELAEK